MLLIHLYCQFKKSFSNLSFVEQMKEEDVEMKTEVNDVEMKTEVEDDLTIIE